MLTAVLFVACSSAEKTQKLTENPAILEDVRINNYDDGLVPVGDIDTHPLIQQHFDWYTHLMSPSGSPVVILAQDPLSRAQILRLRSILQFYLTPRDLAGLEGIDLAFDTMGDNHSTMLFFADESSRESGFADGLLELDWAAFSLLGEENIIEGSDDWVQLEPSDHAFYLCYDMIFRSGVREANPEVFERISLLGEAALDDGIWTPREVDLNRWTRQDRTATFIGQLLSVDFGHWIHSDSPFDGAWSVNSRSEIESEFSSAADEIRSIFPYYYDETIHVDPGLSTSLLLNYDSEFLWSEKSRYFVNVMLGGENDIDLTANEMDNHLSGNKGNNRISGGDGIDTVVLSGPRAEYEIQQTANGVLLFDEDDTRDGVDEIIDVEWIEFSDVTVSFDDILSR